MLILSLQAHLSAQFFLKYLIHVIGYSGPFQTLYIERQMQSTHLSGILTQE